MMKLSYSKKGTKILFVTLLIMALIVTYALPMAVFAEDNSGLSSQGSETEIVMQDAENSGDVEPGGGEDPAPGGGGTDQSGGEDPAPLEDEDNSLIDPVEEPALLNTNLNILAEETAPATGPIKLEMNDGTTYYPDLDSAVSAFKAGAATDGLITFVEYTEPEPVLTLLSSGFPSSSIIIDGKDLTIDGGGLNPTISMSNSQIHIYNGTLKFKDVVVNMTNTIDNGFNVIVGDNGESAANSDLIFDNSDLNLDGNNKLSGRGIGHQGAVGATSTTSFINGSNATVSGYKTNGFFTEKEATNTLNVFDSSVTFNNNGAGLITGAGSGTYVNILNSTLNVLNNGGNGSNGGHWAIASESVVTFEGNGAHGLSAQNLTVNDSTLSGNENGANGIYVTVQFNATNSAINAKDNKVGIASQWTYPGALGLAAGSNTVSNSTLVLTGNQGPALHLVRGSLVMDKATDLTIMGNRAYTTFNLTPSSIYQKGAGVYVTNGILTLPQDAMIYNNRAALEADDMFINTGSSITFGPAYAGILNEAPEYTENHIIDGWYDDSAVARWQAHATSLEDNHLYEFTGYGDEPISGPLVLKAAHGIIKVEVPGGDASSGGGGSSSGGGGTPPVDIPDEETPAGPAPDTEVTVIDESIPAGPLPQTGGIPALALYGIGVLLAAAGTGMKLRKKD